MFPFIFIISLSFLIIAFLTSKLQNDSTNLLISIYSALGPIESGTIAISTVIFISNGHSQTIIKILFITSLSIIFLVNLMGYIVQTPYLLTDRKFLKWANRQSNKQQSRTNLIWFHIISLLSFLTNYKLKMILFSRLFNFECFKFQLQSVQKFKVFNVLSFIGYFPQILALYCCISVMAYSALTLQQLLIFIDCLVIVLLNMVFSIAIIKKHPNFFADRIDGIPINQVFNLIQEMNSATAIVDDHEGTRKKRTKQSLEDISQFDQFAYTSTKRDRNHMKFNVNNIKKVQDEQKCYFEETDSEKNTGSRINSQSFNNDQHPDQVGEAAPEDEQIDQVKSPQNILNVDEYYEDQSISAANHHEEQVINQPISNQEPLELNHKHIQQIEQPLKRSRNDKDNGTPKNTHTKLSEYLLFIHNQQQQQQQPKQQELQQNTNFKIVQKSIESDRYSQHPNQNYMLLINESALIESQPSNVPPLPTPHQNPIQQIDKQNEEAAKKMVQSVISAHHSPKKQIKSEQLPKFTKQNTIMTISINQHHDEKPIKNKSIQKAKKLENHPINPPIIDHPLFNKRGSHTEEEESDLSLIQGKRHKTQTNQAKQPKMQDQKQKIQTNPQEFIALENSQDEEFEVPRPKFYEEFIHQNEQSVNFFKRSHPQSLALFSKNRKQNTSVIIQNNSPNNVPRQPTKLMTGSEHTNDQNSDSTFMLKRHFDRAIKFSSSQSRQRPMTSKQGERFRKFSLQRKPIRGMQGKKMLSLEKIYLQRLSNF